MFTPAAGFIVIAVSRCFHVQLTMPAVRGILQIVAGLATLTLVKSSNIGITREDIIHNANGGYSNILIAIDENVPEDRQLLTVIQVCINLPL